MRASKIYLLPKQTLIGRRSDDAVRRKARSIQTVGLLIAKVLRPPRRCVDPQLDPPQVPDELARAGRQRMQVANTDGKPPVCPGIL
jgi:hypothetical protein